MMWDTQLVVRNTVAPHVMICVAEFFKDIYLFSVLICLYLTTPFQLIDEMRGGRCTGNSKQLPVSRNYMFY
jgi:hypothetical protein